MNSLLLEPLTIQDLRISPVITKAVLLVLLVYFIRNTDKAIIISMIQ